MSTRPPIVAVLGHVDHGKTTLLDAIRHTDIQAQETGGITQHIGAYQVEFQNRLITFIDTPGHAAFSAMRARGGQIADLAILVVAADDGVMPQTEESLAHIRAAGIPFLVAVNKIDLPSYQPEKIKAQLAKLNVLVEGFGGNVPIVEVSAKKGTNLDLLLETLHLLADLQELQADPHGQLETVVIESSLDLRQGPLATLIVKNGTLKLGDVLFPKAKVRLMTDWRGQSLKEAPPSTPVQILGFETVPPVGSLVSRGETPAGAKPKTVATSISLIPGEKLEDSALPIILKTDVVGTLEAITGNLPAGIKLVHAATGAITESDIMLAQTTHAQIIGFRVKPTAPTEKLAQIEKIRIHTFATIYDLLDHLKQASLKAQVKPVTEIELGQAKVLKIFQLPQFQVIGGNVLSGQLILNDLVHLRRADGSIKNAKITSLKIGAKEVAKVKKGEEFGLVLDPQLDTKPGDVIISYQKPE